MAIDSDPSSPTLKGAPGNVAAGNAVSGSPAPALRITRAGRSAILPLTTEQHVVGGSADCDMIILGDRPEPAFAIGLKGSRGSYVVSLTALRDGLAVDRRSIERDQTVTLKKNQTISFDGTTCELEGLGAERVRFAPRRIAATGLLALAAILLFAGLHDDDAPAQQIPLVKAPTAPEPEPSSAAVAAEIRQAIRMAQLPENLSVVDTPAEIRIGEESPALSLPDKAKLRGIIASMSRRSSVSIVDLTAVSSGLDGFVAAAGYTPVRFIIGTDGQRYEEGDTVPSGWRIKEIRSDQLLVSRDSENDTVYFAPAGNSAPRLAEISSSTQE
ncbi:SctD/MshK family protein [Rhizobium sp. LEGMi198b]